MDISANKISTSDLPEQKIQFPLVKQAVSDTL